MKVPALALALLGLALAGCSGSGSTSSSAPQVLHCPGGATVTANGTAAPVCPKLGPSVTIVASPSGLRVYQNGTFSWHVDAGNHTGGHSMHTSIVVSQFSVNDTSQLSGPTSYGTGLEVLVKEHQGLPVTESGEYTFRQPGQYYVRAFAKVLADDLTEKEYWSPEVPVGVSDVIATGNNTVVTHSPGPVMSLSPASLQLHLGDGIVFDNRDVVGHTFTPGPCAELDIGAKVVPSMTTSTAVVFKAPGHCVFTTDDAQGQAAQKLDIDVAP